jgi:hypothetical protein
MVSILRCLLIILIAALTLAAQAGGYKFFPDDPIWSEPAPVNTGEVRERDIHALYDFLYQSFRPEPKHLKPSRGINTLGEVPDSPWFTNRHARRRMTREELQRGPGDGNRPIPPFKVAAAKTEGITPGFQMRDAKNRLYFVKTDPISNPEMATAADVIGSKFFYALGYNTPENYIVKLQRMQISVAEDANIEVTGRERRMNSKDLDIFFDNVPHRKDGTYRLIASLAVQGKPVGPFKYEGTRRDNPNDTIPHETRRDLRGLAIFCAWLNHTDAKGGNTLDVLVEENGTRFIRHYLIDFGAILGSDSDMPKNARYGNEYIFPEAADAVKAIASLGLYSPDWERAKFPNLRAVGRFESKRFDPLRWKSNYPNPAFVNRQPEDEYWAAKQVIAFTNDDIRAIVESGEFSDPKVVDYIVATLAERRDKIGRVYFSRTLPLDNFRISEGSLEFDDLAVKHGFSKPAHYLFRWTVYDNAAGQHTSLRDEGLSTVPTSGVGPNVEYLAAEIKPLGSSKNVVVYLRKGANGWAVVGVRRS